MTTTAPPTTHTGERLITQTLIEQFLYREARHLDDREFEKWLDCYADDCVYWMPAWTDDDVLVEDPQRDISLIYYPNKGGLEDRIFRIRTERSSATSIPEPRTSHNLTNVEVTSSTCGSTGTPCTSGTRRSTRTTGRPSTRSTSPGRRHSSAARPWC
jgi:benzoate/toluate 1,2-dioxygenase beta subunit